MSFTTKQFVDEDELYEYLTIHLHKPYALDFHPLESHEITEKLLLGAHAVLQKDRSLFTNYTG